MHREQRCRAECPSACCSCPPVAPTRGRRRSSTRLRRQPIPILFSSSTTQNLRHPAITAAHGSVIYFRVEAAILSDAFCLFAIPSSSPRTSVQASPRKPQPLRFKPTICSIPSLDHSSVTLEPSAFSSAHQRPPASFPWRHLRLPLNHSTPSSLTLQITVPPNFGQTGVDKRVHR
ncbi:uncharacterized protein J3D65DRAFT_410897 [Phyllosticta citribraziliensis]|uniref:Uncharacterized protein n=1 Tax=Phyllosticta citribraziliensis TaxID=989973 RepID=A0ABR1LM48_9PEZI